MAFSTFQSIQIKGLATALPVNTFEFTSLKDAVATDDVEAWIEKTRHSSNRKAPEEQTASDLGFEAATTILDHQKIDRNTIGVLVFVSKTPDYRSPATAIVLHKRLGLSMDCLAYDCNMGGAGFQYGLQIVSSLLATTNKKQGLLIVGDTTSKQMESNSQLQLEYGDACSAVLVEKTPDSLPMHIQSHSYGEAYHVFMIEKGGYRNKNSEDHSYFWKEEDLSENNFIKRDAITFKRLAFEKITTSLMPFIEKCQVKSTDFDAFLFPQEDEELLMYLANQLNVPADSLKFDLSKVGTIAGATIPYLIGELVKSTKKTSLRVLSCSYGEGFSWAFSDFTINSSQVYPTLETNSFFEEASVTHEM